MPKIEQPVAHFPPSTNMVSAFSVKSIGKKQQASLLRQEQENQLKVTDYQPYTNEEFFQAWGAYLSTLQSKGQHILLNFLNNEPTIENNIIEIKVSSHEAKKEIQQHSKELLTYIRNKLKNNSIELGFTLVEQEEKKRVYVFSNADKYAKLLEENPYLEEFRKTLQLHF